MCQFDHWKMNNYQIKKSSNQQNSKQSAIKDKIKLEKSKK